MNSLKLKNRIILLFMIINAFFVSYIFNYHLFTSNVFYFVFDWIIVFISYFIMWWVYFKSINKGLGKKIHSIYKKEDSRAKLYTILFIFLVILRIIVPIFLTIDTWNWIIFLIIVEIIDYLDSICIKKTKQSKMKYYRFVDDFSDWISRALFVRYYLYIWWVSFYIIWYITVSLFVLKSLKFRFLKTFGIDISYVLPFYLYFPGLFIYAWVIAFYIYFGLFYLSYDIPGDRDIIENRYKKKNKLIFF